MSCKEQISKENDVERRKGLRRNEVCIILFEECRILDMTNVYGSMLQNRLHIDVGYYQRQYFK